MLVQQMCINTPPRKTTIRKTFSFLWRNPAHAQQQRNACSNSTMARDEKEVRDTATQVRSDNMLRQYGKTKAQNE